MTYNVGQKVRASELNPGEWQTITLAASWTNRATYAVASYRKILADTTLHIVLNITGGTTTNGTTIFTLAAGFRPLTVVQIPVVTRIAAAPQQLGAIEIDTSGVAKIYDIGASTTLHTNAIIPLDL